MKGKLFKNGNSLAARIPMSIAKDLGISEGSPVKFTVTDSKLTITPINEKPSLDNLLDLITPENLHGEVSTIHDVGAEIID